MYNAFFCVGINFHVTNSIVRSWFALDMEKQNRFFEEATAHGIESLTILQTCNRTEIYGLGNIAIVREIFCKITACSTDDFNEYCFLLQGTHATEHLLRVSSGLDSQIIGDLEILGQVKKAFKESKQQKLLHPYVERLANFSIQASKEIRSNTKLNSGTSSFAYAAIKIIEQLVPKPKVNILVVGVGKFGSTLSKNICDYLPEATLTLCNRTIEKGIELSSKLNVSYIEFDKLSESCNQFDVIITTVGIKEKYLIDTAIYFGPNKKLIIDLSIPQGVNPLLGENENIQLLSMDDIAQRVSASMEIRQAEIPMAEGIIDKHLNDFYEWSKMYDHRSEIIDFENLLGHFTEKCTYIVDTDINEKAKLKKTLLSNYIVSMREVLQENNSAHYPSETLTNYGNAHSKFDFITDCSVLDIEHGTCHKCKG